MPDLWMPDAVHDPGKGAGYAVGRNAMRLVTVHATAGTNSYNVVKNGVPDAPSTLAQFLVPYDGPPWQFTEVDAKCYDSPPNDDGPGIEIERPVTGGLIRPGLSEFRPLSDSQVYWTGRIVHWLHDEWGVPLDLYDGPRRLDGVGIPGFHGFVNHGDEDPNRSDGVTREEWDAIIGGNEVTPEQMAQIGQWLQDMRDSILNNLVGKNRKVGDPGNGYVADWEWDTRVAIDKRLDAIEKKLGI